MKQIIKVLQAVRDGARTSREVEVATGLSLAHCSAYLGELEADGILKCLGNRKYSARGKPMKEYALREVR